MIIMILRIAIIIMIIIIAIIITIIIFYFAGGRGEELLDAELIFISLKFKLDLTDGIVGKRVELEVVLEVE